MKREDEGAFGDGKRRRNPVVPAARGRVVRHAGVAALLAISVGVLVLPTAPATGRAAVQARTGESSWWVPLRGIAASHYVPGQIIVGLEQPWSRSRTSVGRALRATLLRSLEPGVVLYSVQRVLTALPKLRDLPGVRFAQPNYLATPAAAAPEHAAPNDPSFAEQWAFDNTGQSVNGSVGTPGDDEDVLPAWSLSTGSPSIVIGEVDTGLDYTHPDLAGNVWSNPGGVGGCPAGTHGYDVINSTCDPMDTDVDYGGHGTHVAGILGAVGNNGIGVVGVNWSTTLLPVRWLGNAGTDGTTSDLIAALQWLVQAKDAGVNVRVVNDSDVFFGAQSEPALDQAIEALGQHDILFVTAAGNDATNLDSSPEYPCAFDASNEICVTSSDQSDQLASFANYGPNTVDLAAPGVDILSTLRNNSYGYISGGSMAAPQVAGAAALILSVKDMSASALKSDILSNVRKVPALQGQVRSGGVLDVCAAMPGCESPVNLASPTISGNVTVGSTLTASTGTWSHGPSSYGYQWLRCSSGGNSCAPILNATQNTYTVTSRDIASSLAVRVTASDAGGTASSTSAATAIVPASAGGTTSTTSAGTTTVPTGTGGTTSSTSATTIVSGGIGGTGSDTTGGNGSSGSGGSPSSGGGGTAVSSIAAGSSAPPAAPASPVPPRVNASIELPRARGVVDSRWISLTLICSEAPCAGILRLTRRVVRLVRQGAQLRRRVAASSVGSSSYAIDRTGVFTVRVELTAAGYRWLRGAPRRRRVVVEGATVTGGAARSRLLVLEWIARA